MAYVQALTNEEKIGQLCMFGFSGTNGVSSSFAALMEQYHIGGVALYGETNTVRTDSDGGFSRAETLCADINAHNASDIPLVIALDVEGGNVTRFRWSPSLKSARALGDANDEDAAYTQFVRVGETLVSLGVNLDLAPVLDVARDPDATFLGRRIISKDADTTSRIGLACINGLHDGGCLTAVKHFPGHGATNLDSHSSTPEVNKSLEELRAYELVPFAAAAGSTDVVLVAHILYPQLDGERIASQSYPIITELLRGELGFDGVVMSDDFRMAGLRNTASLGDAAVRFVLAGGDLILCGANAGYQQQILNGLYAALADGTISEERLNESVFRVLWMKLKIADFGV